MLSPFPFLEDPYLFGVYAAHLILRRQRQWDEEELTPTAITEEALKEYKNQTKALLGIQVHSFKRLAWMEQTIEEICPGIIGTIFPIRCRFAPFVEASTMLGLLDVLLPSKITLKTLS